MRVDRNIDHMNSRFVSHSAPASRRAQTRYACGAGSLRITRGRLRPAPVSRLRLGILALVPLLTVWIGCDPHEESPTGDLALETAGAAAPATFERFVVELAPSQTPADLERAVVAFFGEDARSEPLFSGVEGAAESGLDRIFLVHAPPSDPPVNAWDRARSFEEAAGLAAAEPDVERVLEPSADAARAAGGCFWDDGVTPDPDRGWSLRQMNVGQAWELEPPVGGARHGAGVSVCHVDTGYTLHDELDGSLDLTRDKDVLDGDEDAEDPLDEGFLLHPGHGTGTGSVIASRGGLGDGNTTGPGEVTGAAPAAELVEIRAIRSVVQAFDSDVAKAVALAPGAQCDVVSMSLGGRGFFGLRRAVRHVVDKGLIVVAAAGNCVGFVVAPASYDNTIAVAATNRTKAPWLGTSHGEAVNVSAPGEDVYRAKVDEIEGKPGDGTSFATAGTAGVAALWLAYHGREAIEEALTANGAGDATVQDLFKVLLEDTANPPEGWDLDEYGEGIVDARALLEAELSVASSLAASRAPTSDFQGLARMVGVSAVDLRRELGSHIAREDLERFAPELAELALRDPTTFRALMEPPDAAGRSAAVDSLRSAASTGLQSALSSGP